MAEQDWTELDASADANSIVRGVTAGPTKPKSIATNNFVYGWNCKVTQTTAVTHGLYVNKTNFAPLTSDTTGVTGGSIRAAIRRGAGSTSAGGTGFSPMLFINLSGTSVASTGYLLGLEDAYAARIVLAKKAPSSGLAIVDGDTSILRYSTRTFNPDTWVHLRLDSIYNQNGDTVLRVFLNDLAETSNYVDQPTWVNGSSFGMPDFIDDVLGANSGSSPLGGGYAGFAFAATNADRRAYVDYVEILRQKTT